MQACGSTTKKAKPVQMVVLLQGIDGEAQTISVVRSLVLSGLVDTAQTAANAGAAGLMSMLT